MFDIKKVEEEARKEIAEEQGKKAKDALKAKLRSLEAAKQVVRSIEIEITDLKQSIADGTL